MQIGSPGSAYGPGGIMSRPMVGRAVSPIPTLPQSGVLAAALQQARRMPPLGRTDQGGSFRRVATSSALAGLLKGVGSHVNVRHAVIQNELARRLAALAPQHHQEGLVEPAGAGGLGDAGVLAQGVPAPQPDYGTGPYIGTMPQQIATADPSVLLARARLAQMMGAGS